MSALNDQLAHLLTTGEVVSFDVKLSDGTTFSGDSISRDYRAGEGKDSIADLLGEKTIFSPTPLSDVDHGTLGPDLPNIKRGDWDKEGKIELKVNQHEAEFKGDFNKKAIHTDEQGVPTEEVSKIDKILDDFKKIIDNV